MKIKVHNPFASNPEHGCFCCSPHNPIGLNLNFWYDNQAQTVETVWEPEIHYQGYDGVLHGGIQSTLMDEVASWSLYLLEDTAGVTIELNIRYKRPVIIAKGAIRVVGRVSKREKNIVTLQVCLYDGKGTLCTEGLIDYYAFSREKAAKQFDYPGIDAFLPKSTQQE